MGRQRKLEAGGRKTAGWRRLVCVASSLVLAAALVPAIALNAPERADAAAGNEGDNIMAADQQVPSGRKDDGENPYGIERGKSFRMSTQNELMQFVSYDQQNSDRDEHRKQSILDRLTSYDNSQINAHGIELKGVAMGNHGDWAPSYTQAVAFDPYGHARKDHVVYVAYDPGKSSGYLRVVNGASGSTVAEKWLDGCDWLKGNNIDHYLTLNYFAVAAGKFNADSEYETFVTYIAGDNGEMRLREWKLEGSEIKEVESTRVNGAGDDLLNIHYRDGNSGDTGSHLTKLAVGLAVGDFNGDGIDDLAIVSYLNNPENIDSYWVQAALPYVRVQYGSETGSSILAAKGSGRYVYELSGTQYHAMVGAGITAGDIDGDGLDEAVVAGISSFATARADNDFFAAEGPKVYRGKSRVAVLSAEKALHLDSMKELENSVWTKDGVDDSKRAWQQQQPECVAINGQTSQEYLFYSGTLYSFKSDGSFAAEHTPEYFTKAVNRTGNETIGVMFIQSVTVGNFDGNEYGREQVVFTLAERQKSGEDDYFYKTGVVAGAGYQDDEANGVIGTATEFASNKLNDGNTLYKSGGYGGSQGKRLNCLVVAVDRDDRPDGITATYVKHGYVYSDPKVLAVMQASPYFSELGSWGDFEGETSYGFTQSYSYGKTNSLESSWQIGSTGELAAGVVKMTIEMGYLHSFTKEYENSLTESYTTSFVAGPYDSVVVYRTPFDVFRYDIERDGKKAAVTVQVPLTPAYYQLSIDEYNDFVDTYNSGLKAKAAARGESVDTVLLNPIHDENLQQEGHPWGYVSYGSGKFKALGKNTLSLGRAGGWTESSYSKEKAETTSISHGNGFTFGTSLMAGGEAPGFEAWVGISTNIEQTLTSGSSTTTANGSETVGRVANLNVDSIQSDTGFLRTAIRQFGFSWMFGTWDFESCANGDVTPVLGYQLSNITAPVSTVEDLAATRVSASDVELEWKAPASKSGRAAPEQYNVYRVEKGNTVKLNDEPVSGTRYAVTGLDGKLPYSFVVSGIHPGKGEGLFSEPASVSQSVDAREIELRYNDKTGYVEWHYSGASEWKQLVSSSEIKGKDADDVELRVSGGYVQWRTANGSWKNLYKVDTASGSNGGTPANVVKKTVTVNTKKLTASAVASAAKKAKTSVTDLASVTIGKKTTLIQKKAFAKCPKVKTLVIKSKKLTKKGVKDSLKGSKITKVVVKVGSKSDNKRYLAKYKKYFTAKNCGKKVKLSV